MPHLVILEAPSKAKTVKKYLGEGYDVIASTGHIIDLPKSKLGVDVEHDFAPQYVNMKDKADVIKELKKHAKASDIIYLATDPDREGEAIAWHLSHLLGIDEKAPVRVTFNEITKTGVQNGMSGPRCIDTNIVDAQQARRILDRIVGYKLSPFLWKKVRRGLSAGRVQSVAVRLIVEREREIQQFKSEPYYRINAIFAITNADGSQSEVKTELDKRFTTHDDAIAFLEKCKDAEFSVANVTKKPLKRMPAPPFTTSTLQQEAARKLGFSVSQTMMVAQRLYESGLITYMRTDSVNLSSLCIGAAKEEIIKLYGEEYSSPRNFHTHSKGAQEAHEAIRPTYMANTSIEGTAQERRLYDLIWKRTAASQMAEAQIEKTTVNIASSNFDERFIANGEVVKFDGFIKVYRESTDEDAEQQDEFAHNLPPIKEGDVLTRREISSTERYSQGPTRYTEASLVHKLEELGIGRPSTYAPTISTIQQREYVVKGDKKGEERPYVIDTLRGLKITPTRKVELTGNEKGKLLPTDIGIVVNDFLMENFPTIMDYNFTAKVEQQFDQIADGKEEWTDMMKHFDQEFEPTVDKVMNARSEHKAGERQLGIDPVSGHPVVVKIGRYGPVVQIGTADDDEKPRFAQMPADKSMETITLEEALELFKLPRTIGEYEGKTVTIGAGRFGPYVLHNKKYVSLPKNEDPMTVTLETAISLIEEKRKAEEQRHLKKFDEDPKLEVLNGRYGPYIAYDGANYRIPRDLHEKAAELTYEQCMDIIKNPPAPKKRTATKKK